MSSGSFSLLFIAIAAGTSGAAQARSQPPQWEQVWSDEFDGTKLDRSKWKPEISCWGGGNDERQCYTDGPQNIRVADGMLHLIARKQRHRGPDRPPEIAQHPNPETTRHYTSGKIRTLGLASWKYGKIEFRAKPPKGQGTWPAVWMMPSESVYGAWPLSGEIDILEGVNLGARCAECEGSVGENRMSSAMHFGKAPPGNTFVVEHVALPDLSLPSDDFHVWTLEWGKGLVRYYLDGRLYWEVSADRWFTDSPKARGNPAAPFDQPFYLMANLAFGGKLAEENNDKGIAADSVPSELAIDWIRVYQCDGDRDTGLACMGLHKGTE